MEHRDWSGPMEQKDWDAIVERLPDLVREHGTVWLAEEKENEMVNAMAMATYELVGDKLRLLPGHTLPESMRQDEIGIDEINPIALCALRDEKFSTELDTTNAPIETAAGFWHAWGMPCHDTDTGEVTGVRVRYQ